LEVAKQFRSDTMSPVMVAGVIRLIELGLLVLCGMIIYLAHVGLHPENYLQYPAIIVGLSLLTVILLEFSECYQMQVLRNPLPHAGRMLLVWSGAFAFITVALFFLKVSAEFSRMWLASWYILGFSLI